MTQHTPGPWTLKRAAVRSATGRVVARIPALNADDYYLGKRETPPQDSLALQLQREANAALIAAAPAMYEALRAAHKHAHKALTAESNSYTDEANMLDVLAVAIAAAEGRADLGVEPVERPVCTCPFASEGYLSKNCALHAAEGE